MNDRELRAPKKKYFKLEYPTVMNVLDSLTQLELGEYFRAISEYELYGEEPETFSDRTVQMAFKMTARELDYQLEKHYGNIIRGRENKCKDKDTADESTALRDVLSESDYKTLNEQYECLDLLIEEVQDQIDLNCLVVKYPRGYIQKYAEETNWNDRCRGYI